jgi:hypothetical protein
MLDKSPKSVKSISSTRAYPLVLCRFGHQLDPGSWTSSDRGAVVKARVPSEVSFRLPPELWDRGFFAFGCWAVPIYAPSIEARDHR